MSDILSRLSVFDDSEELATELAGIGRRLKNGNGYYETEGAIQIKGLWKLTNDLSAEISKLRKKVAKQELRLAKSKEQGE
jgi:hypothetical protein